MQDVNDWPDILDAVTAEDVMAAARDVLQAPAVTGWLLPTPAEAEAAATQEPAPATPDEQTEVQG